MNENRLSFREYIKEYGVRIFGFWILLAGLSVIPIFIHDLWGSMYFISCSLGILISFLLRRWLSAIVSLFIYLIWIVLTYMYISRYWDDTSSNWGFSFWLYYTTIFVLTLQAIGIGIESLFFRKWGYRHDWSKLFSGRIALIIIVIYTIVVVVLSFYISEPLQQLRSTDYLPPTP